MGDQDKNQFREAVKKIKSAILFEEWEPAMGPLTRLAMFDMLPVVEELAVLDRSKLASAANLLHEQRRLSDISFNRIQFAFAVVEKRSIHDFGLPAEQVNDGRVFLGCTRLDDKEVDILIKQVIDEASEMIRERKPGTEWAQLAGAKYQCCGAVGVAWKEILVNRRRATPGVSLNANMAAAAHYMLARFHVCAAKASIWQMNKVIEMYDDKKRNKIAGGDKDLNSMALKPGSRPFPPDFGIEQWARKGSADGDENRQRCNGNESLPLLFPDVNGGEA